MHRGRSSPAHHLRPAQALVERSINHVRTLPLGERRYEILIFSFLFTAGQCANMLLGSRITSIVDYSPCLKVGAIIKDCDFDFILTYAMLMVTLQINHQAQLHFVWFRYTYSFLNRR